MVLFRRKYFQIVFEWSQRHRLITSPGGIVHWRIYYHEYTYVVISLVLQLTTTSPVLFSLSSSNVMIAMPVQDFPCSAGCSRCLRNRSSKSKTLMREFPVSNTYTWSTDKDRQRKGTVSNQTHYDIFIHTGIEGTKQKNTVGNKISALNRWIIYRYLNYIFEDSNLFSSSRYRCTVVRCYFVSLKYVPSRIHKDDSFDLIVIILPQKKIRNLTDFRRVVGTDYRIQVFVYGYFFNIDEFEVVHIFWEY